MMSLRHATCTLPSWLSAIMLLLPGQLASADPATTSAPAECPPSFIAAGLKALDSPDYFIREDATQLLMDCGPGIYESLKQRFASSSFPDVHQRVFEIAREVFLTQRLGPPRAFLGIQHNAANLRGRLDPRVPGDRTALTINHVFRGSAADRAGLRPGDLIMMLNGAPGTVEHPALNFTDWFRQQRPGVKCKLGVLRGGTGLRFQLGETPGFEPEDFRSIQAQILRHKDDGRVSEGASALKIQQLGKVDARLELEPGDLIVALDDQLLDAREPWEVLLRWSGAFVGAGRNSTLPEDRFDRKHPTRRGPQAKSLQILRGGAWLELTASLRRMPMFLQEQQGPAMTHTVDASAAEAAMLEFNEWWRTQFDPQQRLASPDEDPRWFLRPQRNWK